MIKAHTVFNLFMYGLVIAYILYINFATYYNSGTKFLNFLIKLFNNWIFRLIFLLIVGFFALDLFPYGGFTFAILLTIAFLNTNMLVYKKEISESFVGGYDAAPYEPKYKEEKDVNYSEDDYKTSKKNDDNIIESLTDYERQDVFDKMIKKTIEINKLQEEGWEKNIDKINILNQERKELSRIYYQTAT